MHIAINYGGTSCTTGNYGLIRVSLNLIQNPAGSSGKEVFPEIRSGVVPRAGLFINSVPGATGTVPETQGDFLIIPACYEYRHRLIV